MGHSPEAHGARPLPSGLLHLDPSPTTLPEGMPKHPTGWSSLLRWDTRMLWPVDKHPSRGCLEPHTGLCCRCIRVYSRLRWASAAACGLSLAAVSRRSRLTAACGRLIAGFSPRRAWAPGTWPSAGAAPGVVVAHRLALPGPGTEPVSPTFAGDSFPLGHQGSPGCTTHAFALPFKPEILPWSNYQRLRA